MVHACRECGLVIGWMGRVFWLGFSCVEQMESVCVFCFLVVSGLILVVKSNERILCCMTSRVCVYLSFWG